MRKFYFTFAINSGQPYEGGWVEIFAENRDKATDVFRKYYPDRDPDTVNCAGIYLESEFRETKMYTNGNFGKGCQDILYQVDSISACTNAGKITAYLNADRKVAPGISVMLNPRGFTDEIDLAYIEVKQDEEIRSPGENDDDVYVYTYGDVHQEDYTIRTRIARKDIEEAFSFDHSIN